MPAAPASLGAGRYQVQRLLGEGAMKRVYLARDEKLGRDVAVALIKSEGLDASSQVRVRREAQSMGHLGSHPHIVTTHDLGEDDGHTYIVQEYMAGGSLDERLAAAPERRLPIDEALRVGCEICRALEHAHGQGIVHRDLKPRNVWLSADGTAKLGDFGLATALDASRLTKSGMIVGTASHLAPEQALGSEVTFRSDLYALGCLLYEMVVGQPPFLGGDAVAVISQHINTAPVSPAWHNPEVPRDLETLIMRLLAKPPEDRPESAAAVAEKIERIAGRTSEDSVIASPPPRGELRGFTWSQFVGRKQEMEQLTQALEAALSGQGSIVMIVGEPGIGKTRLAEEFGVYAGLRGAQFVTGHSFEGEAIPYRPFIEAIREYAKGRSDQELRGELSTGAPEVAHLVSEIRARFPDIQPSPAADPEAERLRLFESVAAFLSSASSTRPLVLFLDDLHWADTPSLLMLRHVARATSGSRVLIVGTYRDVDLDRKHPLATTLAALRSERPYERILLRGLPEDDVLALLEALESSEESADAREQLAAALWQETEGNPFFIREVLSHLVEEGKLRREGGRWTSDVTSVSELGIPEGIREVIGRRLLRLSDGCNEMLTLASMMSGGFTWQEINAICPEPESVLLDLLDEALNAQLIQERRGGLAGTYDFAHALVRQTLYEELNAPRRILLHRQIAEKLEELHADNPEPHYGELAHHFFQAAPGGDAGRAIGYAVKAAERAMKLHAYEEAAQLYEMALQAMDFLPEQDMERRYDLLMSLANAYNSASDASNTKDACRRAADVARDMGDQERLGQAALGGIGRIGGISEYEIGVYDEALVDLLEEGLEAVGPEDNSLRAKLLGRLAVALVWSESKERREALSQEAIEIATRVGDKRALAYALYSRNWALSSPSFFEERLAATRQLVDLVENELAQSEIDMPYQHLASVSLERGDLPGVREALQNYIDAVPEREPLNVWYVSLLRAMLALMEGRFDEGEAYVIEAATYGQRAGIATAPLALSGQMFLLRGDQGRLAELEQAARAFAEQYTTLPALHSIVAFISLEIGERADAESRFQFLMADGLRNIPSDSLWLAVVCGLADLCETLGGEQDTEALYEALTPYKKLNSTLPFAIGYYGPVSFYLGKLATMLGKTDEARGHFGYAIEMTTKLGARPFLARTQYEYARMLAGADDGDRDQALHLVNDALETAQELGMARLVEQALELKMSLQGLAPGDIHSSIDALARTVLTEQPDLRPHAAPDGTVTILFSDIEGHTAINERLGDQRWMELLREHQALVRKHLAAHDGYEVKTEGDGFMVAFASARKAVQCAIAIQRVFAARNERAEEPLLVRMGLHTGEPVKEGNDFYGTQVTQAARIGNLAAGGQVLISSLLKELIAASGDITVSECPEVDLKGLGTHSVYAVDWRGSP